jgi:hypothetical protein
MPQRFFELSQPLKKLVVFGKMTQANHFLVTAAALQIRFDRNPIGNKRAKDIMTTLQTMNIRLTGIIRYLFFYFI